MKISVDSGEHYPFFSIAPKPGQFGGTYDVPAEIVERIMAANAEWEACQELLRRICIQDVENPIGQYLPNG